MRIILLGAPGVGKGTQAKLICEKFNMPHISTGDIFRTNMSEGTNLGIKVKKCIEKGELVPDDLTISIVKDRLERADCSDRFLLDGFPRNLYQAKELELFLGKSNRSIDKVLQIDIPKHLIIERIAGRRFCTDCGSSYHIKFNPSNLGCQCQRCGGNLIQRADDKEEIVLNRLSIYSKTTKPIIDFYSSIGKLYRIHGNDTIDSVNYSMCATLQATQHKYSYSSSTS